MTPEPEPLPISVPLGGRTPETHLVSRCSLEGLTPLSPPSQPRFRWAVRAVLVILAAAAVAGGVVILASVPPTNDTFYPRCQLHSLTGLHCPGCGTTRAAHALLNGHILQALAYNALAFLVVPVLGVSLLQSLLTWWTHTPGKRTKPTSRTTIRGMQVLLVLMLVYGVLRNLPWYPFTFLAPHEI